MKNSRIDIASIRKEQIVEAAIAIIAAQGIQHLSLSEIENRAGMSRGQLTYYYPTKEAILLAVFDRLLQLMHERMGRGQDSPCMQGKGAWEIIQHILEHVISEPPLQPEFHALQYTFLSQITHRDDFRERLAILYEHWRSGMAQGLAADFAANPPSRPVSPRAMATIVQALIHGLAMQRAADPTALDQEEVLHLCCDMIGAYLWNQSDRTKKATPEANNTPAKKSRAVGGEDPAERPDPERVNNVRSSQ